MHAQRMRVAIAAGVGMLCTFLPWVKGPIIGSIDGTAGDGWITLVICAIGLAGALSGDRTTPLSSGGRTAALIAGGAAGGLALWKILDFHSTIGNGPFANAFSVGIGLYLLVAAGAAMLAFALASKRAS